MTVKIRTVVTVTVLTVTVVIVTVVTVTVLIMKLVTVTVTSVPRCANPLMGMSAMIRAYSLNLLQGMQECS